MKKELTRQIKECTLSDLDIYRDVHSPYSKKTHNASVAIFALMHGRPQQFLTYLTIEDNDHTSDISFKSIAPFKFEIVSDKSHSLGQLLKEKIDEFSNMSTDDFFQFQIEPQTPVIDIVAHSLIKHIYQPSILNKVISILNLTSQDNIIEVETYEYNCD